MGAGHTYYDEVGDLRWEFAAVLRRLREGHFAKQAEFAERSGLSPKTISDLECGKSDPRLSTLLILIESLPEVTALELIGGLRAPKQRKPATHRK